MRVEMVKAETDAATIDQFIDRLQQIAPDMDAEQGLDAASQAREVAEAAKRTGHHADATARGTSGVDRTAPTVGSIKPPPDAHDVRQVVTALQMVVYAVNAVHGRAAVAVTRMAADLVPLIESTAGAAVKGRKHVD